MAAPVARGELAGRFQNRPRATALTLGLALLARRAALKDQRNRARVSHCCVREMDLAG